jgi:hypothetical protein
MMHRFSLVALFFLLSSCVDRKAITVTVQLGANLSGIEVTKLRLVLYQNQESGFADFDNQAPIDKAVTLSTRIDIARFGIMNIGVTALDAEGRAVGGGNAQVNIDGEANIEAQVNVDSINPCTAGDAADAGCCLNAREDDDSFADTPRNLTDCQEEACEESTEFCQGSCGDGVVQFYRGELCDGDPNCDSTCIPVDETLTGFVRYIQVADNGAGGAASLLGSFSIAGPRGFFGGISSGNCHTEAFTANQTAFLQGSNGDMGLLELVDDTGVVKASIDTTSAGFSGAQIFAQSTDLPFQPGAPFGVNVTGGANFAAGTLLAPLALPPFLGNVTAPVEVTRGQDFDISWDGNTGETVIAVLFDTSPTTSVLPEPFIVCEVASDAGSLTIPAELTQTLDPDFDFELQIGNGLRQIIPGTELALELVNGAVVAGNIR